MQEATARRRIVLTSLPLTALFTAAVLFFGLRYAESEPLVFPAAALILIISAVITGKLLKAHQQPRWILFVWILPAVILFSYMILSMMMQYPANSKREHMNVNAKQLLTAANTALEDMQKAGSPVPDSPYIIRSSDTPAPDTLTETPKDVQISQFGRLYRQKPLIFRYTAEQIHADSQL